MPADDALPDDVDAELWFMSPHERCGSGRDYLFDSHWHTHPGRMSAYCPHDPAWPDYRISLSELPDDLPTATRYWVRGFLAGNLPPGPDIDDEDNEDAENTAEFREWKRRAEEFSRTGVWLYAPEPADDE